MRADGLLIGFGAFLIIGLLHPVIIKAEFYVGTKVWPLFLVSGVLCIALSLFFTKCVLSSLLSVLGFSLLWSILELFQQKPAKKSQ